LAEDSSSRSRRAQRDIVALLDHLEAQGGTAEIFQIATQTPRRST